MATTLQLPIVQCRDIPCNVKEVTCDIKGSGFQFKAGQQIRVSLDNLTYNDPKGKSRTFNILSSPNNDEYLTFAFKMSDSGFKRTLVGSPLGTGVEVKGPFGMFTLPPGDEQIIMIADGIGITPCISMLLYATEEQRKNKITLVYSEAGHSMAYLDDLHDIVQENRNITIKTKTGGFDAGFIKKNIDRPKESHWYISGIPQIMASIKNIANQSGVPDRNLHIEEFAGY